MQSAFLVTYELVNAVSPKINFPAIGIIMKLICRGLWLGQFSIRKLMLEITRHLQKTIQTLITNKQLIHSHLIDSIHIGLMKGKPLQIKFEYFNQSTFFDLIEGYAMNAFNIE